ncbi:Na+/H+ antiporter subunit A [Mycolicibacterium thermoresistibile]|jgi:multicomponent Na+:H+ antiporter subunit A|uniref:NADH:ubiquinone oxidoreductase subunit 5 (Chain L)/multisubunit Na+/H+ antiporter, MnhA subunit n=2 Tax=Mycolicibacterium thermoresistibile TaxID=1797 RepID=A0A100XFP6_MYCTH|nr:Na+/H+ antiporter subunit A [Mycolicibacterium thermoresistibile]EHI12355.1 putative monovalent cation/H+ antiporter subunit A [Mycolicibacterium thermoresistibile ATCC 19527]MCV7190936.1 Na+/H+ antiporter subunit A [Mycolicibacterium thermoresistibile]GAT15725.1 NADH:ubiquinone oxidoreductase subunit 5 (chain L)/multisubunit Na+/H+ antiporter, MnhA subunit [Mycolicibacterium thermoresistibile]SNW16728.1 NADH:ubiquinone oxidoreductase subunit 5 (chain L)/multisubunit Na+/H+ antiporter, MnhA 
MLAILIAHAIATALAPLLVYRWDRKAFYPLALVPLGSLVWVALNWPRDGHVPTTDIEWVPELAMDVNLRFDSLAAVMSVLVLAIGALVLFYCGDYFHHHDGRREKRLPSFAAELVAFSGAMFGLVVSDNMLVLYVFWEITTVLSFLLVGHYAERATSRRAATQALLVTTFGGLAMLAGIVVLGNLAGTYLLSELIAAPPTGVAATVAVVLVLVGALSKSAIVPLHFWLPGAMAAPSPVSAYLHAAAMVKAGVYLVARMTPGFADFSVWRPMAIVLGLATLLLAGWRAIREYDLKLILAFGTVSQLGLITVLVSAGSGDLMLAGLAMLVAHAMFKAALFMVVGIIDHTTGTRDIRRLAWLGNRNKPLLVIAVAAAASMGAIPPFFGFVAKEAVFETMLHSEQLGPSGPWVLAGLVLGSVFTTIYSLRFVVGAFGRKGLPGPSRRVEEQHRTPVTFLLAPGVLAAAALVFGVWPSPVDAALHSYAETVPNGVLLGHYQLALWHGFGPPLLLSAVVIGLGVTVYFLREVLRRRARLPMEVLGNADIVYDKVMRGLDLLAVRTTAITQRGSIPATQSVILSVLVLVPVVVLAVGARDRPGFELWDTPLHTVVAAAALAAAAGTTVMRNRLAAALLVGVTGYSCGAIFAFHGAPDLALTQFLVETVTLVIFVLVLRSLPPETDQAQISRFRWPRAVLALSVGFSLTTLAVFALAARDGMAVAALLPDAAYHLGHGANTVNVILVDIRAWDTMGEIMVLVVAATGVASMVFRHRRFGSPPRVSDAGQPDIGRIAQFVDISPAVGDITWLRGSEFRDPQHRSLVLEVATRIIFPLMMVLSAYFFFAGHNSPGGGFAGGLTAGLAVVLRYIAGGRYELGETIPLDAGKVLGAGLTLAAGTAATSLLLGAPALSSALIELTLPVLGQVTFMTTLFFDLGVYLIVVGLVLDVLRSLGARLDVELAGPAPARAVAKPR